LKILRTEIDLAPPGGRVTDLKPRVTVVEPGRFVARSLDAHTFPGLVALNQALKRRSETAVVTG
jgi:hypothetical protein